jgi:hypothetical protein
MQRLGMGPKGIAAIKEHPFFEGVQWEALGKHAVPAPFIPKPPRWASAFGKATAAGSGGAAAAAMSLDLELSDSDEDEDAFPYEDDMSGWADDF